MLLIFALPVAGLVIGIIMNMMLPNGSKLNGVDVMPLFLLYPCQLITQVQQVPSFLPYGFLFYFILILCAAIRWAVINKNISMGKIFREFWSYLDICSLLWYLGLLVVVLV